MIDNLTSCNASSESRGGREREQKSPFVFTSERASPLLRLLASPEASVTALKSST